MTFIFAGRVVFITFFGKISLRKAAKKLIHILVSIKVYRSVLRISHITVSSTRVYYVITPRPIYIHMHYYTYLVLRSHVILGLGMLVEDLVTETALNLGGLTSMLGFYVGIQARLGKLLVTSNAEVGIFGLFLALVDFHVGQLSRCSFRGRSWGFRIEAATSSYDDGRAILVFVNPKIVVYDSSSF